MISVIPGDPRDPAATALLRASHALMQSLFPAEDNHYLSVDALCAPDILFFTARRDGITVGCGALALREHYGELKSMFVAPAARGTGVADALMRALEDAARGLALPRLRLETGSLLHSAHKLYARHGFTDCGPFGHYVESPSSRFMQKPLT